MSTEVTRQIAELRETVARLHAELTRYNLVAWTSGNVSARVPGQDLMVIKPSGVSYDDLTAATMVVCDLDGDLVEGDFAPSSDTAAHAYVYRAMPEVGGVVHTHSSYATAWAARGESIPCHLTAQADEFGGEIPIGPFALIGGDDIGKGIVATLAGHRSPAVLMRNHGVFTIGSDARAAVKAAVMCEDVARTAHLAHTLGQPVPMAQADIDALYDRYQNVYGQQPVAPAGPDLHRSPGPRRSAPRRTSTHHPRTPLFAPRRLARLPTTSSQGDSMGKMRTQSAPWRAVAVLASVLLVGGVAACGNSDTGGGGTKDDGKITMGFSQVGAESGWRTANTISIKEAATAAGIELKFDDAQQKQENQIKAIRNYIQQKVDVIAFSPVVESGGTPCSRRPRTPASRSS